MGGMAGDLSRIRNAVSDFTWLSLSPKNSTMVGTLVLQASEDLEAATSDTRLMVLPRANPLTRDSPECHSQISEQPQDPPSFP